MIEKCFDLMRAICIEKALFDIIVNTSYRKYMSLDFPLKVISETGLSGCAENTPGDYTPNCNLPERNPQLMCIPRR